MGGHSLTRQEAQALDGQRCYYELTHHRNFRFPPVPKTRNPLAVAKYTAECIARFVSPPQEASEDEEFSCLDIQRAIREHLLPEIQDRLLAVPTIAAGVKKYSKGKT